MLLTVLTISERTTAKHERISEQHKIAAATSIVIDIAIGAYWLTYFLFANFDISFSQTVLFFVSSLMSSGGLSLINWRL